tara:strand:- start:527 stop:628 length:102 start_codon:yes stop_codon:yes gene_type:complete
MGSINITPIAKIARINSATLPTEEKTAGIIIIV